MVYIKRVVCGETVASQKEQPACSISLFFSYPLSSVLPFLLYLLMSVIHPFPVLCPMEVLAVAASCCQRIKSVIHIHS